MIIKVVTWHQLALKHSVLPYLDFYEYLHHLIDNWRHSRLQFQKKSAQVWMEIIMLFSKKLWWRQISCGFSTYVQLNLFDGFWIIKSSRINHSLPVPLFSTDHPMNRSVDFRSFLLTLWHSKSRKSLVCQTKGIVCQNQQRKPLVFLLVHVAKKTKKDLPHFACCLLQQQQQKEP